MIKVKPVKVVLKQSDPVGRFYEFILSDRAKAVFFQYGFSLPESEISRKNE